MTTKRKYSHAYHVTIAIESDHEDATDVSIKMMRAALLRQVIKMDEEGPLAWHDAFCDPETMTVSND
jgi:hypothetical protein